MISGWGTGAGPSGPGQAACGRGVRLRGAGSGRSVARRIDSAAARDELLAGLRQGETDGVALVSVWPDDPLPQLLADSGVPAVLFTRAEGPVPVSFVDVAHRHGTELAAGHLLALCCQQSRLAAAATYAAG